MHTLDSSQSESRIQVELFIQFQILPTLQMSIITSGNVYPNRDRDRISCVVITQKSEQEDVLSLVTVLRLIVRTAGR